MLLLTYAFFAILQRLINNKYKFNLCGISISIYLYFVTKNNLISCYSWKVLYYEKLLYYFCYIRCISINFVTTALGTKENMTSIKLIGTCSKYTYQKKTLRSMEGANILI